jgi:hypothetical protein
MPFLLFTAILPSQVISISIAFPLMWLDVMLGANTLLGGIAKPNPVTSSLAAALLFLSSSYIQSILTPAKAVASDALHLPKDIFQLQ